MRGATANSDSSASSMAPSTNIMPAGTLDAADGFRFWRDASSNSSSPHTVETQVCALNSLAAMAPAMAGVGKCTNSSGTTRNPIVVRLAHHKAATNNGMRNVMSDVTDGHHFIVLDASRRLNLCRIAFRFSNQRARNRAADIDQAQFDISLVLADDLIGYDLP